MSKRKQRDRLAAVSPKSVLVTQRDRAVINFETATFVPVSDVPLPAALPLFATSLGVLGLLGWRGKKKAAALAA